MSTSSFYSSSVAPRSNPNAGCCFYELVHKLAWCLIAQRIKSCIPPQVRCACYACQAYQNYEKRRRAQAPIKDKTVQPGDIFHVSVPGSCCAQDAIFGMSNQHVFQLIPDPLDHNKAKFCVHHKSCSPECKSQTVKPKEGVALVPVEKALTLAMRMTAPGLSFPFRSESFPLQKRYYGTGANFVRGVIPLSSWVYENATQYSTWLTLPCANRRCNSHHYMDYLRYGKRNSNIFWVSRHCPVFGEIDNPNAWDFKLKDYWGVEHPVGPPIQFPPAVTTGQVGDGIRKVRAKIIKQGQECLPCFGGNGFPPPSP